jgi:hypothetical protein
METRRRNSARVFAFAAAVVAAVAVVGLGPSAASAAAPVPVHIELHVSAFCCPEVGTWDLSGGLTDGGTYVRTGGHAEASLSNFAMPEHTGTLQEEFLLTSAQGTLTVKTEGLVTPNGEPFGAVAYSWELEPTGTGAYADTTGHGKGYFDRSTLSVVLDGVISKVGG